MSTTPTFEQRAATSCAAISAEVTMASIADELPPLIGRVAGFLAEHGRAPSGPPFWRYRVIDMSGVLTVEVGFPVAETLDVPTGTPGDVVPGVLPAGTYATTVHVGHPDGLLDATSALLAWADGAGVVWDRTLGSDGEHWACRLEEYLSDPVEEPDLTKWRTRLAFKTAD
ncbi:GyrI-like domain-containing protein [Curtobacterium sp. PhB136]|uniref:GyrI-like domain-containing protein n=1 Tax=Curtobacterium sp. PhB136 TaxID=2485181 RepID=UPI0010527493|nr:GyrI-like domain-containing protein [Curtobacterium sp. PhB136]TCK66380.1 effector-binding domain-containing protein [Curtobacterium sp. PhB136]